MISEREVLNRVEKWAHEESNVRAVILSGSRATINGKVDFLSDYDLALYVRDWKMFQDSDQWLDRFGSVMARFPLLPGPTFSDDYLTRLVMFDDGVRIDFQITQDRQIAPDDYDNGYRVLMDKDGIAASLQSPSYTIFNIKKPSQQEFTQLVNEFYWDFTYVPKQLIRKELPYAKYMLDSLLRHTYLHRLIEWHIGSKHDWNVNCGCHGRWFSRYLDEQTWLAYKATFAGADVEQNWNALFRLGELFGLLGEQLAAQIGYTYAKELENKIMAYAAALHQSNYLSRDADK